MDVFLPVLLIIVVLKLYCIFTVKRETIELQLLKQTVFQLLYNENVDIIKEKEMLCYSISKFPIKEEKICDTIIRKLLLT